MHLGMRRKRRWTSEWHSLILQSALRKRTVAVEVPVPGLLALQRHFHAALKFLKAVDVMHAAVVKEHGAVKGVLHRAARALGTLLEGLVGVQILCQLRLLVRDGPALVCPRCPWHGVLRHLHRQVVRKLDCCLLGFWRY